MGKSTILAAIEFALLPHSALRITDADFYDCDDDQGFAIEVTIGDVPGELLTDERFGRHIRGIGPSGELHDEPADDDEEVLTVRFSADSKLEPQWVIKNDRNGEGRPIGHYYRAKLGMVRLGQEVDRDLSWTRYSALTKFTEEGMGDVAQHLSKAHRQAREAIRAADLTALNKTASALEEAAKGVGATAQKGFRALLEPSVAQTGVGALSLHDGDVPIRAAGLGSRRLIALALQAQSVPAGAIVLLDEIETALEPHRLRHLIRVLTTSRIDDPEHPPLGSLIGSWIFTTHSPVTIRELGPRALSIVRNQAGAVTLHEVEFSPEQERIVRTKPEALLSRRVLVCEGGTEEGFCRGLEDGSKGDDKLPAMAISGTAVVNGNGMPHMQTIAIKFANLGFETALLGDSDVPGQPDYQTLKDAGVTAFLWDDDAALEERVALDLPMEGLREFLGLAVELSNEARVCADLTDAMGTAIKPEDLVEWMRKDSADPGQESRRKIGTAAKGKKKGNSGWFKFGEGGYLLGRVVARALPAIASKPLAKNVTATFAWACRD